MMHSLEPCFAGTGDLLIFVIQEPIHIPSARQDLDGLFSL